MKKAFTDPTLEPVLFGFDVITTSNTEESIDGKIDPDATYDDFNM